MTEAAARRARMRAVRYDRYGGPDRLRLVELAGGVAEAEVRRKTEADYETALAPGG